MCDQIVCSVAIVATVLVACPFLPATTAPLPVSAHIVSQLAACWFRGALGGFTPAGYVLKNRLFICLYMYGVTVLPALASTWLLCCATFVVSDLYHTLINAVLFGVLQVHVCVVVTLVMSAVVEQRFPTLRPYISVCQYFQQRRDMCNLKKNLNYEIKKSLEADKELKKQLTTAQDEIGKLTGQLTTAQDEIGKLTGHLAVELDVAEVKTAEIDLLKKQITAAAVDSNDAETLEAKIKGLEEKIEEQQRLALLEKEKKWNCVCAQS